MEELRIRYYKDNSYPENYFKITCNEYRGRYKAKGTAVQNVFKYYKGKHYYRIS